MSKKETQEKPIKEIKTYTKADLIVKFLPWVLIIMVIVWGFGMWVGWTVHTNIDDYVKAQAITLSK